jgi:hypothetical protein
MDGWNGKNFKIIFEQDCNDPIFLGMAEELRDNNQQVLFVLPPDGSRDHAHWVAMRGDQFILNADATLRKGDPFSNANLLALEALTGPRLPTNFFVTKLNELFLTDTTQIGTAFKQRPPQICTGHIFPEFFSFGDNPHHRIGLNIPSGEDMSSVYGAAPTRFDPDAVKATWFPGKVFPKPAFG